MSSGSRPTTNGLRYCSTAVTTASGRWVKVAHPRPYSPGSFVSTLTTTSRIRLGAVQIALTSVIFRLDNGPPSTLDRKVRPVAPLGPRSIVQLYVRITDETQGEHRVRGPDSALA